MKNKEKKSSVIKKIKVILIEIYRRNAFHPKEDSEQREAYSLHIHVRVRACVFGIQWHTLPIYHIRLRRALDSFCTKRNSSECV